MYTAPRLEVGVAQPGRVERAEVLPAHHEGAHHDVALQVAFERQTLKPVFHLIGYRLWI
jgi:predicted NBD/HSP70 family sugar kinase